MLRHTFLHVPGVGQATERKLWERGFLQWKDYLERCQYCPLPRPIHTRLVGHLTESVEALAAGYARYFEMRLPPGEVWRLYREFREKAAFLDIETTGLYPSGDSITVIGLFDGRETKVFIRGLNLHEFAEEIGRHSLIVTFNGKRFDMPFIRRMFGEVPEHQAHIDLLYPLRSLGYRGGLKSIEAQLGLEREGVLKEVDGFLAVLLWHEYERGNRAALDTLIRYNLEDTVNLQYLADAVYNEAVAKMPIEVATLPSPSAYHLDIPFDAELVRYLRQAVDRMLR
jgi:hypothetical protein